MSQQSISDAETDNADDVSEAETVVLDRSWKRRVVSDMDSDHPDLASSIPSGSKSPTATTNKSTSGGLVPPHQAKKKKRDASGRMLLQKLCDKGDYEGASELIKQGADVNDRDYAGNTALHDAALKGHIDIVRLLLDNGAEIDIRSGVTDLDTPLIDAASHGHVDIVKLLLDRGADPRIYNAQGKTALDFADQDDSDGEQVANLIKEAIVDFRSKFGKSRRSASTPDGNPDYDSSSGDSNKPSTSTTTAKSEDEVPRSSAHTRRGARAQSIRNDLLWMDLTTKTGKEQVYKKAADGDVQFVGRSLQEGWQPDADCLAVAARHGHLDVVNLLLAFGVAPDDLTSKRVTALHETIGRGHIAVIKLLLESGADPLWKDPRGRSYVDLATEVLPEDDDEVVMLKDAAAGKQTNGIHHKPTPEREQQPRKSPKPERRDKTPVSDKTEKRPEKRRAVSVSDKPVDTKDSLRHEKNRIVSAPVKQAEKPPVKVVEKRKESQEPEPSATPKRPKLEKEESMRKMVELQQQRAKERKQREQEMLLNLEREEQQRRERRAQEEARSASVSASASRATSPSPVVDYHHHQFSPSTNDPLLYLPLLVRQTANGPGFVLDVQVSRLLGVANVFQKQPSLSRKLVTFNEKERMWTLVSPWLFQSSHDPDRKSMDLQRAHELRVKNRAKFMETPLFWIRINELWDFLKSYSSDLYTLCSSNTALMDLDYSEPTCNKYRHQSMLGSCPTVLPPRLRGKLIARDRSGGWH